MSGEHSTLPPSASGVWGPCPGSVMMQQYYPDEDNQSAIEGDAVHWLGATVLGTGDWPQIGSAAPNGTIITDVMQDAAGVYVDCIPIDAALQVEQQLSIPIIHPECFGTPDCWWFDVETWTLWLYDMKYGWLIVEPEFLPQFVCYLAGILDILSQWLQKPVGMIDEYITVKATIVQPRPYHVLGPVRTWTCRASDIRPYVNQLRASAQEALGDNPRTISGTHCRYCTARHACPAAQKSALAAFQYIDSALPIELPVDALGIEWRYLKQAQDAINYRLSGIESRIQGQIDNGSTVPGCSIDRGSGRQVWTAQDLDVFAMGDMFGVDLRKSMPITPNQAIKAGIPKEVVKAMTVRGAGTTKIVADNKTLAARVFGKR